ncbi:hypothetical protein LSAT2_022368 [Lamellibrachia satsuma]|nr:hypothetical protein LSAT2_022368 [Lamellibrachia satsuma]
MCLFTQFHGVCGSRRVRTLRRSAARRRRTQPSRATTLTVPRDGGSSTRASTSRPRVKGRRRWTMLLHDAVC